MSLHAGSKTLLRRRTPLSQHTTMQVGGTAEFFAEPHSEEELLQALDFARSENLSVVIIGKGSNLIFPDEGYPGLVISLLQFEKTRMLFDRETCLVQVSAGVHLYRFALACRDQGFGGAEFLASIPGTVGGALVMNAGFSRFPGQKSEIGDLAYEVTVLNHAGEKRCLRREELSFKYRKSNLSGSIVIECKLRLSARLPEEVDREIKACFDYRNQKQDLTHPSSGSIFKNPEPPLPAAARLVDELGLKGARIGGIMVSPKHGNYFINVGGGKSRDVVDLMRMIQEKVLHATSIQLEPEVKIITTP